MGKTSTLGKAALYRKLTKVPVAMAKEVQGALAKSADDINKMQKRLVPKDSHDLEKSITWRWGDASKVKYSQSFGAKGNGQFTVVLTAGNAKVRYAHLVEFGSSQHIAGGKFKGATIPSIPPHPYFYPAFRAKKKSAASRIKRAARKGAKIAIGAQ